MMIRQTHGKEFESLRRREMDPRPTRSSLMSKTLYTSLLKMGMVLILKMIANLY